MPTKDGHLVVTHDIELSTTTGKFHVDMYMYKYIPICTALTSILLLSPYYRCGHFISSEKVFSEGNYMYIYLIK